MKKIYKTDWLPLIFVIGLVFVMSLSARVYAAGDGENWKKAYADYLSTGTYRDNSGKELSVPETFDKVMLIYIDKDNIPEMVLLGGYSYIGEPMVTYRNGKIIVVDGGGRAGITYAKKKNRFIAQEFNMGIGVDTVYKIVKGKSVAIAQGEYGSSEEDGEAYWWNGEKVSKETYDKKLKEAFPYKASKLPKKKLIGVMINQLTQ